MYRTKSLSIATGDDTCEEVELSYLSRALPFARRTVRTVVKTNYLQPAVTEVRRE